jgi:oligopeptide transport system permease protein
MLQFLLKVFLRGIAILVGVTLIVFLLMHAIPGNPWSNYSSSPRMMLGTESDKPLQRELNRRFGLDLPLWRQFTRYIIGDYFDGGSEFTCGAICGNLGPSIQQRGRSVLNVLFGPPEGKTFWESRFGYSIRLVLFGSVVAVGLGIPLGIVSATTKKSALSRTISVALAALISIPNFVLGLLAIIVLASWLKVINVLPNWNYPSNWIVPAVVLAVMPMASIARVTRTSLVNTMGEDYVRTAHGKGLTHSRVILVHVMRNALIPIITFLGPTLMELFAGLFVVENLYSFPGFGRQFWAAILELDYPLIMGLTLIYAAGIVLINSVNEILGEILDPRIRLAKHGDAL